MNNYQVNASLNMHKFNVPKGYSVFYTAVSRYEVDGLRVGTIIVMQLTIMGRSIGRAG